VTISKVRSGISPQYYEFGSFTFDYDNYDEQLNKLKTLKQ
jgi:hypothetical protein